MILNTTDQADVTIVGDVMPGRNVAKSLQRVGRDEAARRLWGLLGGRVVVGNLECALSDAPPGADAKPDGSPNLHAPCSTADWLRRAGFSVMALANNHVMDCGRDGLEHTIAALNRAGIAAVGAGRDLAEAVRPVIASRGGRQIALLAFGNGPAAKRRAAGVAPFSSDALAIALSQVPASADAVVVMVHVGLEFLEYPESHLRQFADEALDSGADVVVGSHPHCVRGVERTGRGVILYSIGDFLADTSDEDLLARHLTRTAMTHLGFDPSGVRFCRQALACDIFLADRGRVECCLRSVVAGDDFLPRFATRDEHREIVERIRRLSRPLRDPDSPEMLRVQQIEKAYRQAYGRGRKLKDWLTLPFRLRPRHAAGIMERLARVVGVSWERP